MASVITDPNGFHRVVFKGLDGKLRPIRLGKCSEKDAILVANHVEEIINAAVLDRPLARASADWLAKMPPKMEAKLVAVGLIHPRDEAKSITLGTFLDAYMTRRSDVKAGTLVFFGHTKRNLIDVFGADRLLGSITPAEGDDFRRALLKEGLAAASVARRCSCKSAKPTSKKRRAFRRAVRLQVVILRRTESPEMKKPRVSAWLLPFRLAIPDSNQ